MTNAKPIQALLLLIAAASGLFANAPRPNILYLFVDDMGWGSIGPNGQEQRRAKGLANVKTPNLDKLAAEGVNFTRSYGCTVCSPSRSSQQTGFHQGHTFADRNDPDNAKKAIRADDVTLGDALAKAGYTTGYWGKWGYGGSKDHDNPTLDNLQTLPTSHGYKHVLAELHHVRAHTFYQPTLWHAPAKTRGGLQLIPNSLDPYTGNSNYPLQPANHNHPAYPTPGYCDDAYCFAALDFVRDGAKAYNRDGTPFFGLLAVQIPHAPFKEIEKLPGWDDAYKDDPHFANLAPQSQQWAAMVTRIDAHFGNLLDALNDPNGDGDATDSVADNTLVLFMSDNGGPRGMNNTELDANGGLRGNKGTIYEGGIRVPTLLRWPAKIHKQSPLKAGSNCDKVIDITDLLPTFCDLAGTVPPVGLDGVSIAPTLTGQGHQHPRDFLIHESGKGDSIIHGKHKLIRAKQSIELYDLDADPAESRNLAKQNKGLVRTLEKLLTGERVDEPKGFANTYHNWKGSNSGLLSKADNWSDYTYQNEGITYQTDNGAPHGAWIAQLEPPGSKSALAIAKKDQEFLGLCVAGKPDKKAQMHLRIDKNATLTSRNGLRIARLGTVTLQDARLSTLRWVDIQEGGTLLCNGTVDGDLHHAGTLSIQSRSRNEIHGDYHCTSTAKLIASPTQSGQTPVLHVHGQAHIAGRLSIQTHHKTNFTLLTANSISGKFSNPGNKVIAPDGTEFSINYQKNSVQISVLGK